MAADDVPADRHGQTPVLGPHVVGQRVVVRRLLRGETGPTGGPAMTDVLGICESWGDGVVVVRREQGDLVEIATADIVSGKPVPPRPSVHRRLDPVAADRLALPGWQPVETEPLGDWVLRASGRVLLARQLGARARRPGPAHGRSGRAGRRVVPGARASPRERTSTRTATEAAAFAAAGWTTYEATLLMLASRVPGAAPPRAPTRRGRPARDRPSTSGWLASDERAARFGEPARQVLEAGEVTFATVRDETGAVIARGRGAFHDDWVGVSSLATREDVRRTGLGSAVLRSLLEWGAERGATTTYLQVVRLEHRRPGALRGPTATRCTTATTTWSRTSARTRRYRTRLTVSGQAR